MAGAAAFDVQLAVATTVSLDETGGAVDSLLSAAGLAAAATAATPAQSPVAIRFDSSLAYGDVFSLDSLGHELGFNEINRSTDCCARTG